MYSLLHDIPRFLIRFLEELFLIFNQVLSIRAFGRRVLDIFWAKISYIVNDIKSNNVLLVCLFLLLYVPSQQLWSLRDGQFT